MRKFEPGEKVTYVPRWGKLQIGIVKSISNGTHSFVVYNCGGDWDHYEDYTAAKTENCYLLRGWIF